MFVPDVRLPPSPGLFAAGGMGLWHGVEYYEEERIRTSPYKGSWDDVSTDGVLTEGADVGRFLHDINESV